MKSGLTVFVYKGGIELTTGATDRPSQTRPDKTSGPDSTLNICQASSHSQSRLYEKIFKK